jgi:hypothetical protein
MSASTYATIEQVRAEFPRQTLLSLFQHENEGAIADANPSLLLCWGKAHSEVTSNLQPIYGQGGLPSEQPASVSMLLVDAELAYLRFFAYSRKPELAAKIGENYLKDLWKFAEGRMDRIKAAVQEIAVNDSPPPDSPANVGGVTFDRGPKMSVDSCNNPSGRSNTGDY